MKNSALLLLTGVYLCILTVLSVMGNLPDVLSFLLCFGGVGLIIAAVHEMIINQN